MNMLIVVMVSVVIIGLFIGLYLRRRAMSFEGTVIDKDVRETQVTPQNTSPGTISFGNTNQSGLKHDYFIKVQTSAGKTITWQLSQGKYEIVKIGDHVSKQADTTDVMITPQVPQNPTPPPTAGPSL